VNNSYKFLVPGSDQSISIPIEMKWDFLGRDDSIEVYQEDVIKIVTGVPEDFEILRFAHKEYDFTYTIGQTNVTDEQTELNYEFYFYSGTPIDVTASTINDWVSDYTVEGFSGQDLYLKTRPFKKSFYKLDFYDSPDTANQINNFTVILPVPNGNIGKIDVSQYIQNVSTNFPSFKLDHLGIREGFFLYWLKSRTFVNLDTFYMSIKFFNAKEGVFVRMMTEPQSNFSNKFVFNTENYFFVKVVLDYDTKKYEIFDYIGNRIGLGNPIKWYEYVNP
jgi:hypothetical protein